MDANTISTWLQSPIGMVAIMILVLLLLGWLLLSGLRGAVNSAVTRSKEAAEIEADRAALKKLKADYEALLGMLRTRDRYLIQYDAVSRLSDDAYQAWSERTWKTVAVNQLAMIRAVRPLVYADYRSRVRAVSASYGTLPGPALSALREQLEYMSRPIAVPLESMLPLGESVSDADFLFTAVDSEAAPIAEPGPSADDIVAWLQAAANTTPEPGLDGSGPLAEFI